MSAISIWDILLNDPTAKLVDAGEGRTTFDDIYRSKLPAQIDQVSYPEQRLFSGYTGPDIRARQGSHAWYTGGMDHYNGPVTNDEAWKAAAEQWVNDRNGRPTVNPWVNTFGHDSQNTFERMRQDNYNPFLGREGGWVGEDSTVSGVSAGYRDDSIAGWFKQQFAGDDMVQHRQAALEALQGWNGQERHMGGWKDGLGKGINKATERMTEEYFNQMDLANKFGLQWQEGSSNPATSSQATKEQLASNALKMNLKKGGPSAGMLQRASSSGNPEWSALTDSGSGSMGPFMLGQLAKRR